jgi:hypothetical protein
MRGVSAEEKSLLLRIGDLMDSALNNRQSSNPYEPSRNRSNRVLYPPTGLLAKTGKKRVQLVWTAANSDEHLRYSIEIRNVATGTVVTKSSYTNTLLWTGAEGSYEAKVKSVGRDGASSTIEKVSFTITTSFMQLEGAKNGPTELGTMVQDDAELISGFSIFVWASVVLDKYIGGESNNPIILKLWTMDGPEAVYDAATATLQQTLTLYPATESSACLDGDARGGSITRPSATRSGSFETSQSVMFAPMEVPSADVGDTWTFFLEATNRDTEDDEVNLSMIIWGGQQNIGELVDGVYPIPAPEDPWTDDPRNTTTPSFVFPNLNSFKFDRKAWDGANFTDTRWAFSRTNDDQRNVVSNSWTVATWFRPKQTNGKMLVQNNSTVSPAEGQDYYTGDQAWEVGPMEIFSRESHTGDNDKAHNRISIRMYGTFNDLSAGRYFHHIEVKVWGDNGEDTEGGARGDGITAHFRARQFNTEAGASYMSAGVLTSGETWSIKNHNWMFLVVCFDGGPAIPGGNADNGDIPKIRVYLNNRSADPSNSLDNSTQMAANAMTCLNQNLPDQTDDFVTELNPTLLVIEECNQNKDNQLWFTPGIQSSDSIENGGEYFGAETQSAPWATMHMYQQGFWNVALDNWNGSEYYNKLSSRAGVPTSSGAVRDSNPAWVPETGSPFSYNAANKDGREDSLTAIHYLYNMGYGSDIDWTKNSNIMANGKQEYPFAENLIHCWQWGALPADAFTLEGEALRDSGSFVDGGDINMTRAITPVAAGQSSNSWSSNNTVADIISPLTLNHDTATGGAGFVEAEGTIAADGTTMSAYAYPGLGFRSTATQFGGNNVNRPDTTDGVLDEPKTYNNGSSTRAGQYP